MAESSIQILFECIINSIHKKYSGCASLVVKVLGYWLEGYEFVSQVPTSHTK